MNTVEHNIENNKRHLQHRRRRRYTDSAFHPPGVDKSSTGLSG